MNASIDIYNFTKEQGLPEYQKKLSTSNMGWFSNLSNKTQMWSQTSKKGFSDFDHTWKLKKTKRIRDELAKIPIPDTAEGWLKQLNTAMLAG